MLAPRSLAWFLCLGLLGCKASVGAEAETGGDVDLAGYSGEESSEDEPAPPDLQSLTAPGQADTDRFALLGARHDLRLVRGAREPSCRCLAVALGPATTPGMNWLGAPPEINPETQLVIALSSEGLPCEGEPKDTFGASYSGYKTSGNSVIVQVEAARAGRPITQGAIIPRPGPGGQVYIEPKSKSVPYGKPLTPTQKLCELGNPGANAGTSSSVTH